MKTFVKIRIIDLKRMQFLIRAKAKSFSSPNDAHGKDVYPHFPNDLWRRNRYSNCESYVMGLGCYSGNCITLLKNSSYSAIYPLYVENSGHLGVV